MFQIIDSFTNVKYAFVLLVVKTVSVIHQWSVSKTKLISQNYQYSLEASVPNI